MISGTKLIEWRKKNNMSRKTLSVLSGVPLRTLQSWETNTREGGGYSVVKKLSEILHCGPWDLLSDDFIGELNNFWKCKNESRSDEDVDG